MILAVGIALLSGYAAGDDPLKLLDKMAKAGQDEQPELTRRFEASVRLSNSPVMRGDRALFFWVGDAKSVAIAGEWTEWKPAVTLGRLPATDVWLAAQRLPKNARLEYKLVVDNDWRLDPRNPNKIDNGIGGQNSWFAMPGYSPKPFKFDETAPKGRIESFEWKSELLGNSRQVRVYVPPGFEKGRPGVHLYVWDGEDYFNRTPLIRALNTLHARKRIVETVAIMVPPVDRVNEYWKEAATFEKAVMTELAPEVEKRYGAPSLGRYATLGASLGGYVSLRFALDYPHRFGILISQSGAFQVDGSATATRAKGELSENTRIWLDYGIFEQDLTAENAALDAWIKQRGFPCRTVARASGHNWTVWADVLPAALEFALDRKAVKSVVRAK